MKVDIRMALALTISVDEYSEVLEQLFPNQAFQNRILDFDGVEKSFQELNEECQSYGLLIACVNTDLEMLEYLWEEIGTYVWTVTNFECVMKQITSQKWVDDIEFIMQSQVTKQMVLSLQSDERSCFIDNFIGDPFGKEFAAEIRNVLISNLCAAPYAGAFLIFLLDNFEELTAQASKPVKSPLLKKLQKHASSSKAAENAEPDFENIWTECL